ncbi:MAG TPA: tetratricopeptide repeat protein [Opitutaceae bacterium]|nr:tetratricopeptide repeat protein [Opitutaceae bacterium]
MLFVVVARLSTDIHGMQTAGDFLSIAKAKEDKGDLNGAIADLSRVIASKPDYAEAYYNRGPARQAKGDREGATADFAKSAELTGKALGTR